MTPDETAASLGTGGLKNSYLPLRRKKKQICIPINYEYSSRASLHGSPELCFPKLPPPRSGGVGKFIQALCLSLFQELALELGGFFFPERVWIKSVLVLPFISSIRGSFLFSSSFLVCLGCFCFCCLCLLGWLSVREVLTDQRYNRP